MLVELSDEELDRRLDEITGHSRVDDARRAAARELYHRLRKLERAGSDNGEDALLLDTGATREMPAASFAAVGVGKPLIGTAQIVEMEATSRGDTPPIGEVGGWICAARPLHPQLHPIGREE